jgi:hypothetical protein
MRKLKNRIAVACLAAPITVVAALSGNISGHIRISQASLLIGDGIAAAVLLLLLVTSARRRDRGY